MNYIKEFKNEVIKIYKSKELRPKEIFDKYQLSSSTFYQWLRENNVKTKLETNQTKTITEYNILEKNYNKLIEEHTVLTNTITQLQNKNINLLHIATELIDKNNYPLGRVARMLQIHKSTLNNHIKNRDKEKLRDKEKEILKKHIIDTYNLTNGALSYIKISDYLRTKGIIVSHLRTQQIMKELGLKSTIRLNAKKPTPSTIKYFIDENKLKQDFTQESPNKFWFGDVSTIRIKENHFHVCIVMDLFSRKVIGHKVSSSNDTSLVVNALKNAYENRNQPTGVCFHSDQGSNYTSHKYRDLLQSLQIEQSLSKPGTPYDNSVVEAFFSTMKRSYINAREFEYMSDLRSCIDEYVNIYNNIRPHQSLNNISPNDFENNYYNNKKDN